MKTGYKSGMVALIGRSNVGKSTLINALTGIKTAIVTPKPQTTRHLIQGLYEDERGQIVFIDTPGFFIQAKDQLSKTMLERAKFAMQDVDVVVYMIDPTRSIGDEERRLFGLIRNLNAPKLCVANKMDIHPKEREYLIDYKELWDNDETFIEISALKQKHLKSLLIELYARLPEGPPLFPDKEVPRDDKQWASEIIREKVFHTFGDELPYGIHVRIVEVKDKGKLLAIEAEIITNQQRHKGMIIGKGAKKLKEIGSSARKELEIATQKKIYLDIQVKVDPNWIDRYEHH